MIKAWITEATCFNPRNILRYSHLKGKNFLSTKKNFLYVDFIRWRERKKKNENGIGMKERKRSACAERENVKQEAKEKWTWGISALRLLHPNKRELRERRTHTYTSAFDITKVRNRPNKSSSITRTFNSRQIREETTSIVRPYSSIWNSISGKNTVRYFSARHRIFFNFPGFLWRVCTWWSAYTHRKREREKRLFPS